MLGKFLWCCGVIKLLLASGNFYVDDLDSVMDVSEHYYNKNYTPQDACNIILAAWPDVSYQSDDVEEPEAAPEDEPLSQEDRVWKPR